MFKFTALRNKLVQSQLFMRGIPLRTFAVNPKDNLSNNKSVKTYLDKYNLNYLSFNKLDYKDPKGNLVKQTGTEYVRNYFVRDDASKRLLIFQLANDTTLSYETISEYLDLPPSSITEADKTTLENTLGIREDSNGRPTISHNPKYENVIVIKENKLREYSPSSANIPYLTNPFNLRPLEKLINLLAHPTVVYKYIDFSPEGEKVVFSTNSPVETEKQNKKTEEETTTSESEEETKTSASKTQKKSTEAKPSKPKHELSVNSEKNKDFGMWYQQTLLKSEMIEYYDISGCYILRPWSFSIWERLQEHLNKEIKALGVSNAYFPMFVSQEALETEKTHLQGFEPEVAWITKTGSGDLNENIAIRPTSETIMYPSFSKWIRSHRDLPLKLNQWSNIVRWEFKHPTPFVRTREFLWQEGHTAHSNAEEAEELSQKVLDIYAKTYEDLLAIPVVKGVKSLNERFAGAESTYTCELFVDANGRGLQGATSHNLGQRFAKMFDIWYEDAQKQKQHVWQTCWGFTFRSVGSMIMIHGDDKGLVLPPKIAEHQVVIVPIYKSDSPREQIDSKIDEIKQIFEKKGVRYHVDDRENYSPGWKFNHWETKGVPIRLEIGPKDVAEESVTICVRHNGEKKQLKIDGLKSSIPRQLKTIHSEMLKKAKTTLKRRTRKVANWSSFMSNIKKQNIVMAPWCEDPECEDNIRTSSTTILKRHAAKQAQENQDSEEEVKEVEAMGGVKTL